MRRGLEASVFVAAVLVAMLGTRLASRTVPTRAPSHEGRTETRPSDAAAAPAADTAGAPAAEAVPSGPLDLAFPLRAASAGAFVRVAIVPERGSVRVKVAPLDDDDYDVMVRSGDADAGSMESSFRLGGEAFAAAIAWDDAMRLASFAIRSGREPGAGATPLIDLFSEDGSTLSSERRPDAERPEGASYVLERVRDGDLDVCCELRPLDGQ